MELLKELKARSLKEVSLAKELFEIRKNKSGVLVPQNTTPKSVLSFTQKVEENIWTEVFRNLLDSQIALERTIGGVIYTGPRYSDDILSFVKRLALYSKTIIIPDPTDLYKKNDAISPHNDPKQWVKVIVNEALAISYLEEWIRSDLVVLIPRPWFWKSGMINEIESFGEFWFANRGYKVSGRQMLSQMVEVISKEKPGSFKEKAWIDKFAQGDRQYEETLKKEVEKDRSINARRFYYDTDQKVPHSEIAMFDRGITVPESLSLSRETGSISSSHDEIFWDQYKFMIEISGGNIDDLTSMAFIKSMDDIDLNLLNDVEPEYVLHLRKQGKLESFRSFLSSLWNSLGTSRSEEELKINSEKFQSLLKEKLGEYKEEWNEIEKDVLKNFAKGGVTGASSVVLGLIDIKTALVGALGGLISGFFKIRGEKSKLKRNPLYVLLRLKGSKYS